MHQVRSISSDFLPTATTAHQAPAAATRQRNLQRLQLRRWIPCSAARVSTATTRQAHSRLAAAAVAAADTRRPLQPSPSGSSVHPQAAVSTLASIHHVTRAASRESPRAGAAPPVPVTRARHPCGRGPGSGSPGGSTWRPGAPRGGQPL